MLFSCLPRKSNRITNPVISVAVLHDHGQHHLRTTLNLTKPIEQNIPNHKESQKIATHIRNKSLSLKMEKATASKIDTISVKEDGENRSIEVCTLHLRTTTGEISSDASSITFQARRKNLSHASAF